MAIKREARDDKNGNEEIFYSDDWNELKVSIYWATMPQSFQKRGYIQIQFPDEWGWCVELGTIEDFRKGSKLSEQAGYESIAWVNSRTDLKMHMSLGFQPQLMVTTQSDIGVVQLKLPNSAGPFFEKLFLGKDVTQ